MSAFNMPGLKILSDTYESKIETCKSNRHAFDRVPLSFALGYLDLVIDVTNKVETPTPPTLGKKIFYYAKVHESLLQVLKFDILETWMAALQDYHIDHPVFGPRRGRVNTQVLVSPLTLADRDYIYGLGLNPVIFQSGYGTYLSGDIVWENGRQLAPFPHTERNSACPGFFGPSFLK